MNRHPVLVLGCGNPSRGDDAAAPELLARLDALNPQQIADGRMQALVDFQLMIEHAEELNGRMRVIFVDASESATAPFELSPVQARRDRSYTSHQMTPAALVEVQRRAFGTTPPEAWQLAIPASEFGLDRPMSTSTEQCLEQALEALVGLIQRPFDTGS